MKYVYGISCYVDYLVYQYIITSSRLYSADVVTRPFTYSFDIFIRCNNSRHVTISDVLSISITASSISSIPTLYHTTLRFSTVFNYGSVLNMSHLDPECHVLPLPITPPSTITWISFDSVINYLALVLLRQKHYNI